jgi:hypothetical protein
LNPRKEDAAGRGNYNNKPVIVAIGASAGGIPALQSFFRVIVRAAALHLSRCAPRSQNMPAVQVETKAASADGRR